MTKRWEPNRNYEPLLSSGEVAPLFRVHRKTVSEWARNGVLEPDERTPGGHYRFKKSTVQALVGEPS